MTAKRKKAKRKKARPRRGEIVGDLHASVEDDLLLLADQETGAESRWNRPRKRRISLRVDVEVVDWFKSKGPGYQTRINRILRRVMMEGKKHTSNAPSPLKSPVATPPGWMPILKSARLNSNLCALEGKQAVTTTESAVSLKLASSLTTYLILRIGTYGRPSRRNARNFDGSNAICQAGFYEHRAGDSRLFAHSVKPQRGHF